MHKSSITFPRKPLRIGMISRLLNKRSYSGGPHFDRPSTLCFELEGIGLELTVPASDFVMAEPPRMLNLPFNSEGWFEGHCKRRDFHVYVPLFTEMWGYFPTGLSRVVNLMSMGSNQRMGELSLGFHLKRLTGNRKLDPSNSLSLGDYIKWEYEDHFESPKRGDGGRGKNHEIRSRESLLLARRGESYRSQYEIALSTELEPTPKSFDLMSFGGGVWTCYRLDRGWIRSRIYSCIPLSDSYYLQLDIRLLFEISEKNRQLLEPDMLRAAEWLRQHIKITFPGKPAGALTLP
jgi:hypothetical protein